MMERALTFRQARRQSWMYAPAVTQCLKENQIEEAISLSEVYNKSHLAKVVAAGLLEFQAYTNNGGIAPRHVRASRRALRRAAAITLEEMKRGLGILATIGSTAPFIGLLGTTMGIITAFGKIKQEHSTGLDAVSGGISEALLTTALGLFVAIPAVWMYNVFTRRIEAFSVEIDNSSSELIDYFLKKTPQG
jgi:biopolymer transport protein ExbB/biopolymer transport protein TolQ